MNPEVKQLWINALKSGEYKQGKHQLVSKIGHCCLGVLGDLAVKAGITKWVEESTEFGVLLGLPNEDGFVNTGVLSDIVMSWAGLINTNPFINECSVATINDQTDSSFEQIADLIKEHL